MAISSLAKDIGVSSNILSAVIDVNEKQPETILQILKGGQARKQAYINAWIIFSNLILMM